MPGEWWNWQGPGAIVPVSKKTVYIESLSFRSPESSRKQAIKHFEEHIKQQRHTVVSGTFSFERPRFKGRFMRGWNLSVRVVPFGMNIGLASGIALERPGHSLQYYEFDQRGLNGR